MVKEILEITGLDRKQLAEKADMSFSQINDLIAKKKLTLDMLVRLCNAAAVPITIGGRQIITTDEGYTLDSEQVQEMPVVTATIPGFIMLIKKSGMPVQEFMVEEAVARVLGQPRYPHRKISGTTVIWGLISERESLLKRLPQK